MVATGLEIREGSEVNETAPSANACEEVSTRPLGNCPFKGLDLHSQSSTISNRETFDVLAKISSGDRD